MWIFGFMDVFSLKYAAIRCRRRFFFLYERSNRDFVKAYFFLLDAWSEIMVEMWNENLKCAKLLQWVEIFLKENPYYSCNKDIGDNV